MIASIVDEDGAHGSETTSRPPVAPLVLGGGAVDAEVPKVPAPANGLPVSESSRWALEASVITAVDRQEDFDDAIGGLVALRRCLTPRWALL